ncbi:hypothetical protein [Aquicoccus sp. SU-CL01552]|uniref:hypothetical protein n=1 Tax=Aquicoccus sp. SU-CL01552 TaxID=3127656 RepID=UPI0033413A5C
MPAIRDARDLGYLVTQVTDACLTCTADQAAHSLRTTQGYCRQVSTDDPDRGELAGHRG